MNRLANQSGLDLIKVNKVTLLDALVRNKEDHVKEYQEAMEGFRSKRVATLAKHLKAAEAGEKVPNSISFSVPACHEDDYTTVIKMLEMSVDKEVFVTMHEFQQYVEDKWSWKQNFDVTNAMYKA